MKLKGIGGGAPQREERAVQLDQRRTTHQERRLHEGQVDDLA